MIYSGDSLGIPHLLALAGGHLLVTDIGGGASLHVIAEGRRLASFGRRGQGPGEFSAIRTVQPSPNGRSVWLYDLGNTRLTLLDLDSVLAGRGAVRQTVVLRTDLGPMNAVRVSDSLIVSSGLFTGGRLALFTGSGTLQRVAGPLPPAREGVPAPVAQHAYTGTLVRHPHRPWLALATRHADRVEIYALDGTLRTVARGPAQFEPVYEVQVRGGAPTMATGEDLRFGYVDAAAAGDGLYALYSGYTRSERPGRANFGQQVHLYDWQGRLHRVMQLDQPVLGIAVTDDGRTLYAVRHDPYPAILRYRLPADE
ncbi:MAG TPA: BF3164 family lipoprotein [Longimicrobium sp.]